MRQRSLNLRAAFLVAFPGLALAAMLTAPSALAQGLSYQKAVDDPIGSGTNIFPSTAYVTGNVDNDNLWGLRSGFGSFNASLSTYEVWQAGISEDVPELRQHLSGLTPNTSYDFYAAYWTDDDENWTIQAGTTSGANTLYSFNGDRRAFPVAGSTVGLTAGAAIWSSPPPPTIAGTIFTQPRVTDPVQPFDDPLVMLLGYAGRATTNGAGEIDVFVNDLPFAGAGRRTWFDGVAYVAATGPQAPVAMSATVDRDTGAITVNNPTGTNFQIKSYTVDSLAGGLNAPEWSPISDSDVTWTIGAPADPANTPFATELTENGGNNITIAASGGSRSFGNVWNKSPFEDVRVYLTLADDSLAVLSPSYSGSAAIQGDFDGNDTVDLVDYETLLNSMHTNLTPLALSAVQRYRSGDLTGDSLVNFLDFQAFRTAYDDANGAGAFAQRAAQVPEPSSVALVLGMVALVFGYARQRRRALCVVFGMGVLLAGTSGTAFAVDIAIDIDTSRTSGTATAGPFVTQSGFTSWNLTDVATSGNTIVVDGITFELSEFAGINQSRVRGTVGAPNGGGGPLNDLLADFVFNEGADQRFIRLAITGLPVGTHLMQSFHLDTGVPAPEATQVEVGDIGGTPQIVANAAWSASPIPFLLEVTNAGVGKEIIFRESSAGNRARLNGFTISPATELTLEVNTTTGATRILNEQASSFDVSYYEIRSASGSLNPAGWTSLDDGEGGAGGAGDYNGNSVVDAADYVVWRNTLGQNVTPGTGADGNNSGTIDPGDYTVWRSNFGSSGGDPIGSGWDEVPNSTANILSELNLESMDTFDPTDSASLGAAFSVGGTQDLFFSYSGPSDDILRSGLVKYVTSGSGAVAAVPEPATLSLLGLAAWLLIAVRRPGRAERL